MTDNEDTDNVGVYTGWPWRIADARECLGQWLEARRRNDTNSNRDDSITKPVYISHGPRWLIDIKL